ncbi:hypothetical protein OAI83_02985 [Nitrosopumilus sp.]|nr:hypothetical protein [Nitrosopumilus sp.]
MKKITIRCLTYPSKGYGNFSRCLNIAESLSQHNCVVSFVIDYNKFVINELKKRKFNFISIPLSKSIFQKNNLFKNYLKQHNPDLCIIDMREYGENLSKKLFNSNFKVILFDDAWSKQVYANIIFNGTNIESYHNYKLINKKSKLFLGTKYWILDKNFKILRKKLSLIKNKKKYSVVISMGGSDKYNLTTTTVKSLLTIDNLHLSIIIGPFFSHKKTLMKIISSNPNISLHISPSKIWQIFSTADVAVCTGGNTLFELACMGIPTLSIPSVEHEIKYTEKFNSQNFSLNLKLREKNLDLIKSSILQLIYDVKLQKKMSIHGQKIIDGKGLSRVTKEILNLL